MEYLLYICPINHHTDRIEKSANPKLKIVCWKCLTLGVVQWASLVLITPVESEYSHDAQDSRSSIETNSKSNHADTETY